MARHGRRADPNRATPPRSGDTRRRRPELRPGGRSFGDHQTLVMAIINRTPIPSTIAGPPGMTAPPLDRLDQGGRGCRHRRHRRGEGSPRGSEIDIAEEVRRVAGFVATARDRYPDIIISVDTYRSGGGSGGECRAGRRRAERRLGWLGSCRGWLSPRGQGWSAPTRAGFAPRTRPTGTYRDVTADVVSRTVRKAERAAAGGSRESDHDRPWSRLRKNTFGTPGR